MWYKHMTWCQRVICRHSSLLGGSQERLIWTWGALSVLHLDNFKELVILEQLRNGVPHHIEIYLDSQEVAEIRKAAMLSDSYELAHREV